MATLPIFTTFVAGTVLTAAALQQATNINVLFAVAPPLCFVSNSSSISLPSGTITLMTFDTEVLDPDNMHSTVSNTSRIVCQTLGTWDMNPQIRVSSGATGFRTGNLRLNSGGAGAGGSSLRTVTVAAVTGGSSTIGMAGTWWIPSNIGDYVELFCTQNNGTTLTTDAGNNVTGMTARLTSI